MADLLDAETLETEAVDDSDLESRLTQEREQVEENATEQEQPSQEEEEILPPKFQGKTVEEIVQSYQNLEQHSGRQSNELGELRKLADSLIQKNLTETNGQQLESTSQPVKDEDFFADPVTAVRRVVEEALQPVKANLTQTQVDTTMQKLQVKHPDVAEIVNDMQFQDWVMGSTPRQDMWVRASQGEYEYADELFSQYKAVHKAPQQAKQEENRAIKSEELAAASAVSSGSSKDATTQGKPRYRRAELIRLRMNDPARYASLHDEIMQAYSEGRVS